MQQRQLNRTSNSLGRQHGDRSSIDAFNWESDDFRIPCSFLDILIVGAFANWASGAAMHRKITRQSRWNLRRASDKAIPNQAPGTAGEGVETGRRAPLEGQRTIRLASTGQSHRLTQT